MKLFRYKLLVFVFVVWALSSCNFPAAENPTPFNNPTLDLTQTGIPPSGGPSPTNPSPEGQTPAATLPGTATSEPAPTNSASVPDSRPQGQVRATYLSQAPAIDANLSDWNLTKIPVNQVVFGRNHWNGESDLSAQVMFAWDNQNFYIAGHVTDDKYVQNAKGGNIYLGDSLEILFDTDLQGDYYQKKLSIDDYQIGISPGNPSPGKNPGAFLWYPKDKSGALTDLKIAAKANGDGYDIEVAIPWDVFNITPQNGKHYGFVFSVSDNDNASKDVQQSMVSTDNKRSLLDPTAWGDLQLVQ